MGVRGGEGGNPLQFFWLVSIVIERILVKGGILLSDHPIVVVVPVTIAPREIIFTPRFTDVKDVH